jgi:hypothetical protein
MNVAVSSAMDPATIPPASTGSYVSPAGQAVGVTLQTERFTDDGASFANVDVDVSALRTQALNVSIAFDESGSFLAADYRLELQGVQQAINSLRAQFRGSEVDADVQMVRFGSTASAEVFDLYDARLDNVVARYPQRGGSTNYTGALRLVDQFLDAQPAGETDFVIFISDGWPNVDTQGLPAIRNEVRASASVAAFGIGPDIDFSQLQLLDNTGGAQIVTSASQLAGAITAAPIFALELVDFSLSLSVQGGAPVVVATEADLTPDGINFDLDLAGVSGLASAVGASNVFTASVTFDADNNLATTADRVTVTSSTTVTGANAPMLLTGTAGNDFLLGGYQGDKVGGGAGNDQIAGLSGNDVLTGGLGQDLLVGGAGADIFAFTSPTEGGDTIADFAPAEDSLQFARATFGGAGATGVTAGADGVFTVDGGAGAFLYEPDGDLWWQPNGDANGQVHIVRLTDAPVLTAADFLLL